MQTVSVAGRREGKCLTFRLGREEFGIPVPQVREIMGIRACTIVVQVRGAEGAMPVGAVVDGVSDVLTLANGEIENTPDFGDGVAAPYLLGMTNIESQVKILPDIDAAPAAEELLEVRQAMQ